MASDSIPLFGPEMLKDPYPFYAKLRAEDPVHWSETFDAWILTSFDAVAAGLNDLRLSSDRAALFQRIANDAELEPFFAFLKMRMILNDPPRHTRLRGLVNKAFTPHVVESMRTHVQQLVDGFIDNALPTGRMDLIRDFAFPLPATVITEMLGVPAEDRDQLKTWSDAFVVFFSTHPANVTKDQYRKALVAMRAMVAYFESKMPGIRASGKSCLLQSLSQVHDGDHLRDEEVYANANLLLVAGHETTTNIIGNGMVSLLRNPDQMALLRADPSKIPGAIEEFLRHDTPVQFTHRVALEDVTIGGKTIRKGQFVFLFLAAANRDPAMFPDPDRLDVTRAAHKHLAFGLGHHFCLGAPLARLECLIAFTTLLKRLPNLRLAGDDLVYRDNVNLRGLDSLPVTFDSKSA